MTRYALHLFDRDSHTSETFGSLEEAALWLLAWAKKAAEQPGMDHLFISIKPYMGKEE